MSTTTMREPGRLPRSRGGWRAPWRLQLVCVTAVALITAAPPADATVDLVEGDSASLDLSGYVRTMFGVSHIAYELPSGFEDDTAIASSVARLQWRATLGSHWTVEVHDRLFWSQQSGTAGLGGSIVGIGASRPPDRTLDLSTSIFERDDFTLEHDVDRAVVRLYLDAADVTVGRQAITWGNAFLFPVADLWSQFSPFELDTSEKRGIDAARVLLSPALDLEIDLVVADRGSTDDLSAGGRVVYYGASFDLQVALMKQWRDAMAAAGLVWDFEKISLHVDALLPWTVDESAPALPRATIGTNWLGEDWTVTTELHFNGEGEDDPADYLTLVTDSGGPSVQLGSEAFQRGETYLLGRYYAGANVFWTPRELLRLGVAVLSNLREPSVIASPSLTWQAAQNADLSFGAYLTAGEPPSFARAGLPELRSEYGSFGQFGWMQLAVYF